MPPTAPSHPPRIRLSEARDPRSRASLGKPAQRRPRAVWARLRARCAALSCVAALTPTQSGWAAPTDPATAEVLFREGVALLHEGKLDEACPRFLESQRLDPASGTLIAVATCHERQGRLATAWSEFTEAAGRAAREGREDRLRVAESRAQALEPRLSRLTVRVADGLQLESGLVILRDGVPIGPPAWNRPLPSDGGVHSLRVELPGRPAAELKFKVPDANGAVTVDAPWPSSPLPPAPTVAQASDGGSDLSGTQVLGLGVGAAGLVSLAAGGGFLVLALDRKADSGCGDGTCPDQRSLDLSREAVDFGNLATVLGIGGTVLTAAGLALYWAGGSDPETGVRARVDFTATPSDFAAHLQVSF